jgi:hypothetical protein
MKTIDDLLEEIKKPDFVWKHDLTYFIYEPDQGFGEVLIQQGTIDSDKMFKIPRNISGTFNILITGKNYRDIRFKDYSVNIFGKTVLNIPLLLKKSNYDLPF